MFVGLPTPGDLLMEARARHLLALINHAPQELWALLHADSLALRAYQEATKWIWHACARDYNLSPHTEWHHWQSLIRDRPTLWRRICTQAHKRWRNYRILWSNVEAWQDDLYQHFQEQGLWKTVLPTTTHRCLICEIDFSQARAWFLHAHTKHGYQSIEGRAVQGQYCPQCNRIYTSPLSLHHHLRYSTSCRTYFWLHRDEIIAPPLENLNFHPQCPWLQGPGEMHQELTPPSDPDFDALKANLQDALIHFVPPERDEDLVPTLVHELWTVLCVAMPYMTIVKAFTAWRDSFENSPDQALHEALHQLLQYLIRSFASDHPQRSVEHKTSVSWEHLAWSATAMVPKSWKWLPHEVVFLHFYSGHRRVGDVQNCLEEMPLPEGCILSVASVDVAVDASRCDLMQPIVQRRWLSFIRDGFASGLGNGPPCETWTVARHQAVEALREGGPRPLRDDDALWGKPDLHPKEAHQVYVGNTLMGFSVQATVSQGLCGGFAYMEHPGDPLRNPKAPEKAASIWHTDIIQKCLELPEFHLLHVFQGHYGGLSAKPTGLLLTGIDESTAAQLAQLGRTTSIPLRSSIGRSERGWKTSELKTYPPDFCRFLAGMFSTWIAGHAEQPRRSISEKVQWIWDLCVQLEDGPEAWTAQPDFCQAGDASNSKNLFC